MKRILLFIGVNVLVVVTIGIVTSLLGIHSYITAQGISFTALLIFSAVVGFAGAIISLLLSRWLAKRLTGVRVIHPHDPLSSTEALLLQEVQAMCDAARIPMPEVGIYPSNEINAFATGSSRYTSLVAVSSGLMQHADMKAIRGVLAHEVSHIKNGDMVTMTLLQGVINTFVVFLSRVAAYAVARFVRSELQTVTRIACMWVFDILLSILGSIVVLAFSRYREFGADRGAATLVGSDTMIHALESLRRTEDIVDKRHASIAAFKISNKRSWAGLFSSHPPLEDRIARLAASPLTQGTAALMSVVATSVSEVGEVEKCTSCTAVLRKHAKFCHVCGNKVEVVQKLTLVEPAAHPTCGHCGVTLRHNAKFCHSCGQRV